MSRTTGWTVPVSICVSLLKVQSFRRKAHLRVVWKLHGDGGGAGEQAADLFEPQVAPESQLPRAHAHVFHPVQSLISSPTPPNTAATGGCTCASSDATPWEREIVLGAASAPGC